MGATLTARRQPSYSTTSQPSVSWLLDGASGINIPRQASVVGYDDSRLARGTWAGLTTIGQDSAAIARAAVERAIARIGGEPAGKPVLIKPTLIERATTAQPTAGPPKAQP